MREKLHRIIDLMLDLNEQGATRTSCSLAAHVNEISVWVWECEVGNDDNTLYREHAYYDGNHSDTKKVNEIIHALEELKVNI